MPNSRGKRGEGRARDGARREEEPVVELEPFEAQKFFDAERVKSRVEGLDEDSVETSESYESGELGAQMMDEVLDPASASDSQHDLLSGDQAPRVPGYAIEGVIGRGATGVVYRARQEAVDRPVALKVLHSELITNRRAVRRLKREARLAARLAHPSIISAIDMGVVDGLWWYAMELVVGVSLARRIAERGSLTERECLRIFSPLCDALQHAHEVGVVHRDIKPANILLDQRGRARLVDLGLAVGHNDPSITKTGSTLGTPHYVSPEQARDPSDADIRSDLWSVGATMYHAVCGRPPFSFEGEEGGVAEILSRVLYRPVIDPREFAPELSKGFALLLRKCLTRDPEQRYQEPWELVADIETLRERRRLDLRGSQVDSFASRRPAWVMPALAVFGVLAAITGTWAITARPWEPKQAPREVAKAPTIGDWPELHAIEQEFQAGRITHADALVELRTPSLAELPVVAQSFQSKLLVGVKSELNDAVDGLIERTEKRVSAALEKHDFDGADRLLESVFLERLRAETGFGSAEDLPPGRIANHTREFVVAQRVGIRSARDSAMKSARAGVREAYENAALPKTAGLLKEGRYAEAIQWLVPEEPLDWLERASAPLDLRGLGEDQLLEIVDSIAASVNAEEARVQFSAGKAYKKARDILMELEGDYRSAIEGESVMAKVPAETRFAEELAREFEADGFDPDRLPAKMRNEFVAQIDGAVDEIQRLERVAREQLARDELSKLERDVRAGLKNRDYETVAAAYREARQKDWRVSTFKALDLRVHEAELLTGFLALIAEGVTDAHRSNRTLTFAGISRKGSLDANDGDVLRLGFQLRTNTDVLRVYLRPVDDVVFVSTEKLLGPKDMVRFSGLEDATSRSAVESLTLAAFWLAEGKPREASAVLPSDEPPPEFERLLWDLQRRIDSMLAPTPGSRPSTERPGQSSDAPVPRRDPRTVMEAFGTPNQATLSTDIRLVWNFVDDSRAMETFDPPLVIPLPEGKDRFGAWQSGLMWWENRLRGIALDREIPSKVAFLSEDYGPDIGLSAPLDQDRAIQVVLDLRPGDANPRGHLLCVSLLGHHLFMIDGRAWFGSGDLHQLYEHVVIDRKRGDFGRFNATDGVTFLADKDYRITIELTRKRLILLKVNGTTLKIPDFRVEPSRDDLFVRLRSRGPMALRGAEIRGKRRKAAPLPRPR